MTKMPNVGEVWIDDDSELCKVTKIANGRVYRKFLNDIGGRKGSKAWVDLRYFTLSWKRSEKDLVNQILRNYD